MALVKSGTATRTKGKAEQCILLGSSQLSGSKLTRDSLKCTEIFVKLLRKKHFHCSVCLKKPLDCDKHLKLSESI